MSIASTHSSLTKCLQLDSKADHSSVPYSVILKFDEKRFDNSTEQQVYALFLTSMNNTTRLRVKLGKIRRLFTGGLSNYSSDLKEELTELIRGVCLSRNAQWRLFTRFFLTQKIHVYHQQVELVTFVGQSFFRSRTKLNAVAQSPIIAKLLVDGKECEQPSPVLDFMKNSLDQRTFKTCVAILWSSPTLTHAHPWDYRRVGVRLVHVWAMTSDKWISFVCLVIHHCVSLLFVCLCSSHRFVELRSMSTFQGSPLSSDRSVVQFEAVWSEP